MLPGCHPGRDWRRGKCVYLILMSSGKRVRVAKAKKKKKKLILRERSSRREVVAVVGGGGVGGQRRAGDEVESHALTLGSIVLEGFFF